MKPKIVILGAGYAGLVTALSLKKMTLSGECDIVLVNKHNYHQLITQLHETAAGAKPDESVMVSLNNLLVGKQIELIKDTVKAINPMEKQVLLSEHEPLQYDYLVVSVGSETEYFGIPGLKEHSFTLKSMNQAKTIRAHIEQCFANYSKDPSPDKVTIAVGGAGFSGIELVGELADHLPQLSHQYGVPADKVKLYCIEAAPFILPGFDPSLVERARTSLEARGVEFIVGVAITGVEPGIVKLKDERTIPTQTLIWTGGVRGSQLVIDAGFETEPRGRAKVDEHLRAIGYDDVYIIGDACFILNQESGRPYPPTAQIAIQMGEATAANIYASIKGLKKDVFVPHLMGSLASLGRKDAIGKVGSSFRTTGWLAYRLKEASKYRYLTKIGAMFHR